jgi:hypothetical protein
VRLRTECVTGKNCLEKMTRILVDEVLGKKVSEQGSQRQRKSRLRFGDTSRFLVTRRGRCGSLKVLDEGLLIGIRYMRRNLFEPDSECSFLFS